MPNDVAAGHVLRYGLYAQAVPFDNYDTVVNSNRTCESCSLLCPWPFSSAWRTLKARSRTMRFIQN